ncbi:RNA-directed DNA polymerase, eukaryota, reverse transcriptase zinc-binding domain protein [Tanacetum coccineum]
MPCLKINLSKSHLFGIGVPEEEVMNIARAVNCSYGSLPFSYLVLPVGKDMNRIEAWSDIVNRFTKKLSSWKANLLSIGGRLTLVKLVLGDENKMVWIRWQKILSCKKDGGLGVGSIKAKNMGLMGKWKWRFFNETDALWRKVIIQIHGSNGAFHSRGEFTLKSLSHAMQKKLLLSSDVSDMARLFSWNSWVPRKVSICAWRVFLDRLPTRANLVHRGIQVQNPCCVLCEDNLESMNHCFFSCPKIKILWLKIWNWWKALGSFNPSLEDIMKGITDFSEDKRVFKIFMRFV